MAKSLGNGIDPIVMMNGGVTEPLEHDYQCEGYGADAIHVLAGNAHHQGAGA